MRWRLLAIICLWCTPSLAAEPSALTGDDLKRAVSGAVIEVDTPVSEKVPIHYFEDGRLAGEARGLAYILGSKSDRGKWWVSSDRLCHKWGKWFDGVLQCMRISRDGARIFWRRDDGETGTAVIVKQPRVIEAVADLPTKRDVPEAEDPSALASTTLPPEKTARADSRPAISATTTLDIASLVKKPTVEPKATVEPKEEANRPLPVEPVVKAAAAERSAKIEPKIEPRREGPVRPPLKSYRVRGVALDDVLNMRDGPSADHAAIGAILPDAKGVSLAGECVDDWCPITYRGRNGWVNSFYLTEEATDRGAERSRRGARVDR